MRSLAPAPVITPAFMASESAPSARARARRYHTWMNGTLLLEACGGEWETSVVQLVHPVFGDIGHYV